MSLFNRCARSARGLGIACALAAAFVVSVEARGGTTCGSDPTCVVTVNGDPVTDGQVLDWCADKKLTIRACSIPGCTSSKVRIKLDKEPTWCEADPDSFTTTTNGVEGCFEFSCTPGQNEVGKEPQEFQFQANNLDFPFKGAECDFYVNVICCEDPWCDVTPSDRFRVEATKKIQFTVCAASNCGNQVMLRAVDPPDWCGVIDEISNMGETICRTVVCEPGVDDVGDHEIKIQVKDAGNERTTMCVVKIRVDPLCPTTPTCSIRGWVDDDQRNNSCVPVDRGGSADVVVCVGEKLTVSACINSQCAGHEILGTFDELPSFCAEMDEMRSPRGDLECVTLTCTPGPGDVGDHTISLKAVDLCNGQKARCRFTIRVIEPKDGCDTPPLCEVIGPDWKKVEEGGRVEIQVCGSGQCTSDDVTVHLLHGGEEFCTVLPSARFDEHDDCLTVVCEPKKGDEGEYQLAFRVIDNSNQQFSDCIVFLEVNCVNPPYCNIWPSGPIRVQEGDAITYKVCGESACKENSVRVSLVSRPPFCQPVGHIFGEPGGVACLEVDCVVQEGFQPGTYWAKYLVEDLDNGQTTHCSIGIILEEKRCDDPPVCEITSGEEVTTAEGVVSTIDICVTPLCEGALAEIHASILPPFCVLTASSIDGETGRLCQTYTCSPQFGDAGGWSAVFVGVDTSNFQKTQCVVKITVEEGVPSALCMDIEPNSAFSKCTLVDAADCDSMGSTILAGSLDDESGQGCDDVDYYCIVGLAPSTAYCATVVGEISREKGGVIDTRVGLFDDLGGVADSDDDSGPFPGSSMLCFTSNEDGTATLAVTGGPDADFDGADDADGVAPHAVTGAYSFMITPEERNAPMPVECQADLSADGQVDTADLGILLGIYGTQCQPR